MVSHLEMSVGFDSLQDALVEDDDGEMLREIIEARLWKVSLVSAGADRQTRITEAASLSSMLGRSSAEELRRFERERRRALERIAAHEKQYELAPENPWSCLE